MKRFFVATILVADGLNSWKGRGYWPLEGEYHLPSEVMPIVLEAIKKAMAYLKPGDQFAFRISTKCISLDGPDCEKAEHKSRFFPLDNRQMVVWERMGGQPENRGSRNGD